jgi:hypothetical protein
MSVINFRVLLDKIAHDYHEDEDGIYTDRIIAKYYRNSTESVLDEYFLKGSQVEFVPANYDFAPEELLRFVNILAEQCSFGHLYGTMEKYILPLIIDNDKEECLTPLVIQHADDEAFISLVIKKTSTEHLSDLFYDVCYNGEEYMCGDHIYESFKDKFCIDNIKMPCLSLLKLLVDACTVAAPQAKLINK